jgi:isopenicillin N synthase-like dioxygenase
VDVGAWDGKHLSNTYSLLSSDQSPWLGVLIEADRKKYDDLCTLYSDPKNVLVNAEVSCRQESTYNLVNILNSTKSKLDTSSGIDFLCIDIDGPDYWVSTNSTRLYQSKTLASHVSPFLDRQQVLQTLLSSGLHRPRVICIEFNPTMPDDLVYIPPCNESDRHGASISALVELAGKHNYVLVETTLYNAFFVEQPLYDAYLRTEVPDTSIEYLYEPTMATSLYQLYDGTLKLWGCRRMLWHRLPIAESKLQMIPEKMRHFPFAPTERDTLDMDQVVDLAPFFLQSSSGRDESLKALIYHLRTDGFAYIKGIPINAGLVQRCLDMTQDFLHNVDEGVRRSCFTKDRARRGYSAMNTENFASLIGKVGPNDLVRKFRVGPAGMDQSSSLWQPNVWPSPQLWESAEIFQETVMRYFIELTSAAAIVVQAICQGLLAEDSSLATALEPLMSNNTFNTSILTLLGYRTGTRHKGKNKGPLVAPHTDVGVVTILVFDAGDCAVLQRSDGAGGWIDVQLPQTVPNDPIFVVNIADCFSDITGKRLPSTLHRVAARSGTTPRNCCALFVGLDPSQELAVDGKSMTYEEWRKDRIARAQEVLRGKVP